MNLNDTPAKKLEYAFLGGGAMASAIIRGLLAAKPGESIGVSDIHQPSLDIMAQNIPGLFTTVDNIVR
jgi:pyrroline-5-carboxylate reductase